MRIALRPGHGEGDPGACGPAGCEADWTEALALALAPELQARGHEVLLVSRGSLTERAASVDAWGAGLSLHLHGDVGTPAIWYYPGNTIGESVGWAICRGLAWTGLSPGRRGWLALPAAVEAVPRAHALLGRERCASVLLELVDMRDGSAVTWLRSHLDDVARAIAEGVGRGP